MSQLPASPTGLFNKFDVLSKSSAGTAVIEEPPVDVEVPQITAAALKQRISTAPDRLLLIDVRHSEEHAIDHLPGSTLVPFSEITRGRGIAKIQTLLNQWQQEHPDQPPCDLIVYCTAGIRSEMALCLLKQVNIRHQPPGRHSGLASHRSLQAIEHFVSQPTKELRHEPGSTQTQLFTHS
jgi:rhodanese-related sulfurtransferase